MDELPVKTFFRTFGYSGKPPDPNDMKKVLWLALIVVFAACSCACKGKDPETIDKVPDPGPVPESSSARVYVTTFDKSAEFSMYSVSTATPGASSHVVSLTGDVFQRIQGFGLAVTQAACYNLLKMTKEDRTRLLTELFSVKDGAGASLIRVCIGGSDFSMDEYTWCDEEGIEHFAVHPSEEQYLFPVLDEIYRINPDVEMIGSPWSCPRWMKMDVAGKGERFDSWTSGRLNPQYYADYATYFVKWIQSMQSRGYRIWGITLQNEPLNHGNSMSLYMPWQDQRDFLKVVGPAFKKAGLSTRIFLFDHNYNYDGIAGQQDYPLHIFADEEASRYAAGSAWHNYGGNVSVLNTVHSRYPDKEILFTEASIGKWNYDNNKFAGQLAEDFEQIILGTLSRWGCGVVLWNLMLDDEGKPYRPGGCGTCYGAVSVSHSTYSYASLDRKSHWFDVLHASVAIRPGAVRLGTEGYSRAGLLYQVFRNPDGTLGVVILNKSQDADQLLFVGERHSVRVDVPAESVVSVVLKD